MVKRKGFTLIELVIAMAVLFVFIYMSFSIFTFVNTFVRTNQSREVLIENISNVLDQLSKEIRQTITYGTGNVGIVYPSAAEKRDIFSILADDSPQPGNLGNDEYYVFDNAKGPILRFYVYSNDNVKHRITYTLGVPTDSYGNYKGLPRQYWINKLYEPCQILYSNETSTDGGITWSGGIHNQPITDQVITNFVLIRPSWSDKVVQILIEAFVKDASGKPTKIVRILQITLRQ
ncbi:MAG: prepilin-type N-terminal cleavage/methylation domain-containing protein [Caldisericaceae bacterium]